MTDRRNSTLAAAGFGWVAGYWELPIRASKYVYGEYIIIEVVKPMPNKEDLPSHHIKVDKKSCLDYVFRCTIECCVHILYYEYRYPGLTSKRLTKLFKDLKKVQLSIEAP